MTKVTVPADTAVGKCPKGGLVREEDIDGQLPSPLKCGKCGEKLEKVTILKNERTFRKQEFHD